MSDNMNISWPQGWEIRECIGKGGFGSVYLIERDAFGDVERKALKVISIPKDEGVVEYMRCEGFDDESITTTLCSQVGDIIGEYKTMAKMSENPHIVHCDDFHYEQREDGIGWKVYIKMELLTPLTKAIDQMGTEAQVVRLGKELCSALIACREIGIVHRDIKPQNIFISPKGNFKLGDFGIARTMDHATVATVGAGSFSFMAPEVAFGKKYGETVDVYSLGLVMYWLLNERRSPFVPLPPAKPTYKDNDEAKARRFGGEQLPAPKNGSRELQDIILKACAFEPDDRYQSAAEMLADLNALEITGNGQSFGAVNEKKDIVVDDATVLSISSRKNASVSGNTPRFSNKGSDDRGGTAVNQDNSKDKHTADDEVKNDSGNGDNRGGTKTGPGPRKPWALILALAAVALSAIAVVVLVLTRPAPATQDEPVRTCSHVWDQADCKTLRTCIACGETGEVLGDHVWTDADCVNPETCSLCGETRGTTAEHVWIPADCTNPETCSVCAETRGVALEHSWIPATDTTPATCDICGATSGDTLKKQLVDLLRQHLPFTTYSMSGEEKVYGYEDEALTLETTNYFVPYKDELVVLDISEDGSAMEVRYPSRITQSGYRTRWFPVEDVISLSKIQISTGKTTAWTNTYRINQATNTRSQFGSMTANSEYIVLGIHESGDIAILYHFDPRVVNGLDVQVRLALLTEHAPTYSGKQNTDPTLPTEEIVEETLPDDEDNWGEEDYEEENWDDSDWEEDDWMEDDWEEDDWEEDDWDEEDWEGDEEEEGWEDDWIEDDWGYDEEGWDDEAPVEDFWGDEEPVEDDWVEEAPVEDDWSGA